MEILALSLQNYRNFPKKHVAFDPALTVFVGPNGAGKSNILEAVGLLSGVRSKKVDSDMDLILFGADNARIEGKIKTDEPMSLTLNFLIEEGRLKKSYMVDGGKKRLFDFVQNFSLVIFAPGDMDLVGGSPSLRRHLLDSHLSSVDREYFRSTSSYNKVVVRRNRILFRIREGDSKSNELDFWDQRLLEHGKYVARAREAFFEYLNFVETGANVGSIVGLSWELKQSSISEQKLRENRERDIAAGVTLSGPHRDDFRFLFNKKDLAFFGSRGEARMAVLALKLAFLEHFNSQVGVRPVLALDDIFSELDWEHRDTVLSVIGKQQTIITAAERESLPKQVFKKAKVIEL